MPATHTFESGDQVVAVFGPPRLARRRSLVRIRPIAGERETFRTRSGELVGNHERDLVVLPCDGSDPYPCKTAIFAESWTETEAGSGLYRRSALARVVPVPEGQEVVLRSLEGELRVRHPDYIAIGIADEVYANSAAWVAANLEFLPEADGDPSP